MDRRNREARGDELIDRLAEFSSARARTSFLRQHDELWEPAVVERLYARVVQLARIDVWRALLMQSAAQGTLVPFLTRLNPSAGAR